MLVDLAETTCRPALMPLALLLVRPLNGDCKGGRGENGGRTRGLSTIQPGGKMRGLCDDFVMVSIDTSSLSLSHVVSYSLLQRIWDSFTLPAGVGKP